MRAGRVLFMFAAECFIRPSKERGVVVVGVTGWDEGKDSLQQLQRSTEAGRGGLSAGDNLNNRIPTFSSVLCIL